MELEILRLKNAFRLRLRVSPGAQKDRILGAHGGALKLTVAAAPEKGKANKELLRFLAKSLGMPKSSLELVQGEASQDKVLEFTGIEYADLNTRLLALLAKAGKESPK